MTTEECRDSSEASQIFRTDRVFCLHASSRLLAIGSRLTPPDADLRFVANSIAAVRDVEPSKAIPAAAAPTGGCLWAIPTANAIQGTRMLDV